MQIHRSRFLSFLEVEHPDSRTLHDARVLRIEPLEDRRMLSAVDWTSARLLELADRSAVQAEEYSAPELTDLDGDGLLDLLVGEKTAEGHGAVRYYRNVGSATEPRFADPVTVVDGVEAGGCLGVSVAAGNWDGDGVTDLVLGRSDGTIVWRRGLGVSDRVPRFAAAEPLLVGFDPIDVGARATVELADYNADGRIDLVTGALDGVIRVFLTQSGDALAEPLDVITVPGGRSAPRMADLNGDGLQDLVTGNTDGRLYFCANTGGNANPLFSAAERVQAEGVVIDLPDAPRSRPAVGDLNGDGAPDLLVGSQDGLLRLCAGGYGLPVLATLPLLDSEGESFELALHDNTMVIAAATWCSASIRLREWLQSPELADQLADLDLVLVFGDESALGRGYTYDPTFFHDLPGRTAFLPREGPQPSAFPVVYDAASGRFLNESAFTTLDRRLSGADTALAIATSDPAPCAEPAAAPTAAMVQGAHEHIVFASSNFMDVTTVTSYPPSGHGIHGIQSADFQCTSMASQGGLIQGWSSNDPPVWKAILWTPDSPAPDRIQILGSVRNTNGELVANDAAEFWGDTHLAAINYTEYVTEITDEGGVWTGLRPAPHLEELSCGNWDTPRESGWIGRATNTTATWKSDFIETCDHNFRIYCISPPLPVSTNLGTLDYYETTFEAGSPDEVTYEATASRTGLLSVAAYDSGGDAANGLAVELLDEQENVLASGARIDFPATADTPYFIRLSGDLDGVTVAMANLVEQDGAEVRVHDSSQADRFTLIDPTLRRFIVNAIEYDFSAATIDSALFSPGTGDAITVYGTPGDDAFTLAPRELRFERDGVAWSVDGADSITVHGLGGADTAALNGGVGDEFFRLSPGDASMTGDGYANRVLDVATIVATASGDDGDVVVLLDSPNRDRLRMNGRAVRMCGPGYDHSAFGFRKASASAFHGGLDRAVLLDTDADERFLSTPSIALLGGEDYVNVAHDFEDVDVYAGVGDDHALLIGSMHDDWAGVSQGQAVIKSPRAGNETAVQGFDTIEIDARGGYDALLYIDSPEDDVVDHDAETGDTTAALASSPTSPYLTARGFERVSLSSLHGGDDELNLHDTARDDLLEVNADDIRLHVDVDPTDDETYCLIAQAHHFHHVHVHGDRGGVNKLEEKADEEQRLFELMYIYDEWDG